MRERADKVIFSQGLSKSRSEAQALIDQGLVWVEGKPIVSRHAKIETNTKIHIADHPAYVSRGAVKLAAALEHFHIAPHGLIALDIGASTGGFSEILLRQGIRKVYAIDVGENQLAPSLRANPSLLYYEKINARDLTPALIPEKIDIIVCDVSFISLKLALPPALLMAASQAHLIALIKPQFEVGKEAIGKKGIVRDPILHHQVCADISQWLAQKGWDVKGLMESPILGGSGNKEFLIAAKKAI